MNIPPDWERSSVAEIQKVLSSARERRLLLAFPDSLSLFDVVAIEAVERARVLWDAVHGQLEAKVIHPTAEELRSRVERCDREEYEALKVAVENQAHQEDAEARKRLTSLVADILEAGSAVPISVILEKLLKGRRPQTRWAYWREYQRESEMHRLGDHLSQDLKSGVTVNDLPQGESPWVLLEEQLPFRVIFEDEVTASDRKKLDKRGMQYVLIKPPPDLSIPPEEILYATFRLEHFARHRGIAELVANRQIVSGGRQRGNARKNESRRVQRAALKDTGGVNLKITQQESNRIEKSFDRNCVNPQPAKKNRSPSQKRALK
jgi:hypothetical protein